MITIEDKENERNKALKLLAKCKEHESKLNLVPVKVNQKTIYLTPVKDNDKNKVYHENR